MPYLCKYNTAIHIYIPITKRAVVDYAVSADWTPAAGDVKITKDEGAAANVTNLPVAVTMGNTALWDFSLTSTELSAARIRVTVADAATKAVEDDAFDIFTFGNASAQYAVDFSDATAFGLSRIDAAISSRMATFTLPTNFSSLSIDGSGRIDLGKWIGTAPAAVTASGYLQAVLLRWLTDNAGGTPNALQSGRVDSYLGAAANAVITAATFAANALDAVWSTATRTLTAFGFNVTVATNNDKTGYSLTSGEETAIADALLKRDMSAVSGEASRSLLNALRLLRNKWSISGTTLTVTKEDDATSAYTAVIATTPGDPVSSVDPT